MVLFLYIILLINFYITPYNPHVRGIQEGGISFKLAPLIVELPKADGWMFPQFTCPDTKDNMLI
ncbi:MAG: hypothetical protein K0R31_2502 [Clostridiales bacterium]|jgi:hypothetical protein|nr:hypothetical protein [Clostridiales bacterium]